MVVKLTESIKASMRARGIESFHDIGFNISSEALFEPPCSIKWMSIENSFRLGAFSYAVSGYFSCVTIGRYTSIGEAVQIGRASHPTNWVSTSPFFHVPGALFDVGSEFDAGSEYANYSSPYRAGAVSTMFKPISIGNDVYVGHGAMIMPGVSVGDGAIVGANSVVTKDVPPFSIVAGNPARLIRLRLDPIIVGQLLQLQWWRFAPWQLCDVNFSDPAAAIESLQVVNREQSPYAPDLVAATELC